METTNIKLYSFSYSEPKTYIFAILFIIGNIALPQLCHLFPMGGKLLLPIYFFTLIGAYKYGITVGLLTAVLSPIINSALFGMPATAALLPIIIKSTLLALAASYVAHRQNAVTIAAMIVVVLTYQIIGSGIESLIDGSIIAGLQDFRIGILGMLLQIFGGYALIKYVIRK
jgi:hypothetical protein